MTKLYTFKDCVDGNTNIVDRWLRKQPPGIRAKFYSDFKYFAIRPMSQWPSKKTFMMKGEFSELREFRIPTGPQYRLAGFEGPTPGEVTLCTGWTRSQNSAAQLSAKRRALDIKRRVEEGEVAVIDHVI